jgi:hypothetical protein
VFDPHGSVDGVSAAAPPAARSVLAEARAEVERLSGWLLRLGVYGDQAPPHIVEAVRSDYRERTRSVVERIAAIATEAHTRSAAARESARDVRERRLELRLRYLVGEMDAAGLELGLAEQEAAIAAAEAAEAEAAAAGEAATSLLEELGAERVASQVAAATVAPRLPLEADGDEADGLAFLDRLPASEPSLAAVAPDPPHAAVAGEPLVAVTPRSLLTCRSCGAGNDPSHWYCDGCGGELS